MPSSNGLDLTLGSVLQFAEVVGGLRMVESEEFLRMLWGCLFELFYSENGCRLYSAVGRAME